MSSSQQQKEIAKSKRNYKWPVSDANSLQARFPSIASQWHPSLNGSLTPSDVTYGSSRAVWWQCPNLHEWQRVVHKRTLNNQGCPVCGKTSLLRDCPEIAKQLHPTKNAGLDVEAITACSQKKLWWQCEKVASHSWEASVSNRTSRGSGCPFCLNRRADNTNSLMAKRPDIAQEWHPFKNGDLRASDVVFGSERKVWWLCGKTRVHEWQCTIDKRTIRGQGCPKCAKVNEHNNLAVLFPEIAAEWHPTKNRMLFPSWDPKNRNQKDRIQKNRRLKPSDVAAFTKEYIWWQCKKSALHEWCQRVSTRTAGGAGCPFCAGRKVGADNSLAAKYPTVSAHWHPSRNGELGPGDVTPGISKVVWWRCLRSAKHVWSSPIYSVVKAHRLGHTGCPFCAKKKLVYGEDGGDSLESRFPDVAKMWHPTRNLPLLPSQVTPFSQKKVWWRCQANEEHTFEAIISNVIIGQSFKSKGCSLCSGHKVAKENSLHVVYPEVAAFWDKSRNLSLSPKGVTPMSSKSIHWRCPKFHEWEATVKHMVQRWQKGWYLCTICAAERRKAEARNRKG